eukprot:CAMPEP_0182432274 /NCGR_PEP_ID=MMETSP1167-20130531/55213_1 /TAXON_ID=2988 /ORGANISM="Mallomonas Sp, Strain CCMP3275" /LENGTH=62 /DNA_ID=CAMNT_0024619573 /DNA_START=20 /DNA_END=205 /DNA_ORIENTATION=-
MAQSTNGFIRENIAMKATNIAFIALENFSEDPDICGMSLAVIGYSLCGPNYKKVHHYCLQRD